MAKTFTNQTIVGTKDNGTNDLVVCHKCKNPDALIGMRSDAYFDPYLGNGKYVHQECLSDQRKEEIRLHTLNMLSL